MNPLTAVMLFFSLLGAIDRILGDKFGLGREFERGFSLLAAMALSMVGMMVLAPFIATLIAPVTDFVRDTFHIDPSIIPASLFANDMGGAPLAKEIGGAPMGIFNALVVSSMMGCAISFTIPYALSIVRKEQHKELLVGFLCGIITIPVGSIVSGLVMGIPFGILIKNLSPLIIFAIILAVLLITCPNACVKVFSWFGTFINIVITIGLMLGALESIAGVTLIKGLDPLEDGAIVCFKAAIVLSGAFPLVYIVTKLLKKPLRALSEKLGVNEFSAVGFLSTLATSATTYGTMQKMDKKGVVLNGAFTISAAFVFGSHLAYSMSMDTQWNTSFTIYVIIGKLVAGVASLFLANFMYNKLYKEEKDA